MPAAQVPPQVPAPAREEPAGTNPEDSQALGPESGGRGVGVGWGLAPRPRYLRGGRAPGWRRVQGEQRGAVGQVLQVDGGEGCAGGETRGPLKLPPPHPSPDPGREGSAPRRSPGSGAGSASGGSWYTDTGLQPPGKSLRGGAN